MKNQDSYPSPDACRTRKYSLAPIRYAQVESANERVSVLLGEVKGSSILHVGCVGELPQSPVEEKLSLHFKLCGVFKNARVLGIDTNKASVERMREKGFDVQIGDAENLEFDACLDMIIAGELIEHLSNPGRFLEACRRSLKPTGRIVLSTPNPFSPMYFLMYVKNFTRVFNPEHTLWMCPQTLHQIAERYGFRVTKMFFVDDLRPEIVPSLWYRAFAQV